MKLELHTISRDDLFDAKATYLDGKVTVKKGSRINLNFSASFKPSEIVMEKIKDPSIIDSHGILLQDITFNSLSTAATFVAGRISNGMITWKTPDGRYVRYTLKGDK